MSVSTAQLNANERNAQKSTGPRTIDGKQRSSQNSTSIGIYAKSPVLPGEDPQKWHTFRNQMLARLNPRDHLELQFAEQVITSSWNLNRLRSVELRFVELRIDQELYSRQEAKVKLLVALRSEVKALKLKLTIQNTPENRGAHEEGRLQLERTEAHFQAKPLVRLTGEEMLAQLMSDADPALERLYRHQQRLTNSVSRAMKQLEKLQRNSICQPDDFAKKQMSKNEPNSATAASESGYTEAQDQMEGAPTRVTAAPAVPATSEVESSATQMALTTD